MIIFDHFSRISEGIEKCKVYIKLTIIQGKNSKLKGEKLKQKTHGFGKIKNAVCRKSVEKKGCAKYLLATYLYSVSRKNMAISRVFLRHISGDLCYTRP